MVMRRSASSPEKTPGKNVHGSSGKKPAAKKPGQTEGAAQSLRSRVSVPGAGKSAVKGAGKGAAKSPGKAGSPEAGGKSSGEKSRAKSEKCAKPAKSGQIEGAAQSLRSRVSVPGAGKSAAKAAGKPESPKVAGKPSEEKSRAKATKAAKGYVASSAAAKQTPARTQKKPRRKFPLRRRRVGKGSASSLSLAAVRQFSLGWLQELVQQWKGSDEERRFVQRVLVRRFVMGTVFLLGAGLFFLTTLMRPVRQLLDQQQRIERVREHNEFLEGELIELQDRRDALLQQSTVERLAREDHGLIFPGETRVFILDSGAQDALEEKAVVEGNQSIASKSG